MIFLDYISQKQPICMDFYREEYDDTYEDMLDPTAYNNTDEDLIVYAYYNPEDLDHDIYFNQFRYILKEVSEGYSPIKTMKTLYNSNPSHINPIKAALAEFKYEYKNIFKAVASNKVYKHDDY